MVSLLDGDFAQQIVSAGGLQCLAGAVICGDAEWASQAQSALLCIREKLTSLSCPLIYTPPKKCGEEGTSQPTLLAECGT
jgi:hypothetical protein